MRRSGWCAVLCVVVLAFVPRMTLAQSLQEVAAGATKNREAVKDFRSAIVWRLYRYDKMAGSKPVEESTTKILWAFDGAKYRQDRTWEKLARWSAGKEQKERLLKSFDDVTAYDGNTTRMWDAKGKVGMYRDGSLMKEARAPRATHVMLSETLGVGSTPEFCKDDGAKVTGTSGSGEDAVVVIEAPFSSRDRMERNLVKVKVEVLPQKGYVVGTIEFYDKDDRLASLYKAEQFKQYAGGLWLPHRATREYYAYDEEGGKFMNYKSEATLESFEPDAQIAESQFSDIFPEGAKVVEAKL